MTRLREIFDETNPLYTRRWKHVKMRQKPDEEFLAWKARHYVSFINAKMTEMSDEDHMVLSLLLGTKEGKIKSKITSLTNPTMKEVENIARTEMSIASIKDATSGDHGDRAYRAEGNFKKECHRCSDNNHLSKQCTRKLWCDPCKSKSHNYGSHFCRHKEKGKKREEGNRRSPGRYGDRRGSSNSDKRGRSPGYGGQRDNRGKSPSYSDRRRSPGRYGGDRYRTPSTERNCDSARRVKNEKDRGDNPPTYKDATGKYGEEKRDD